jgi:hypothetical protein
MNTAKSDLVIKIFDALDAQEINFVTMRGFDLIPHKVSQEQDVDLLVHPDSVKLATQLFKNHGFNATSIDPKDTVYLYGAHPGIYFVHKPLDIAIHVVEELAYKSLNKCEMVPLDKNLQESIFENKRRVDEIWKYMPSYEDEFLMLLCRCIYDKRTMPQKYMDRIKELFRITNMDKLQEYCSSVFMKSTPMLLSTIANGETECIFERYITFCDY